jgi:hypothetical protein
MTRTCRDPCGRSRDLAGISAEPNRSRRQTRARGGRYGRAAGVARRDESETSFGCRLRRRDDRRREAAISEKPSTLEDYRVRMGAGRLILMLAARYDDGALQLVEVGITADTARDIASRLVAHAERVERERR